MKKIIPVLLCLALLLSLLCACSEKTATTGSQGGQPSQTTQPSQAPQEGELLTGKHHVAIDIKDYGTIELELDADVAPISVTNFIRLAQEGFYDGLTFHRIMNGFMMQGGAGEGAQNIKGEFAANGVENNIAHVRGVISMARANPYDSGSSQFFIVHQDSPHLDGQYAAFGHVTSGMEIVDQICTTTPVTDGNGSVPSAYRPVIETVRVID